jgi:UDP-N-acetylglucosamine:LPS N-acetylglucosamine transferase
VNHLEANELDQVLRDSRIVLARAGYSTIMDLAALGKKAILIPTPGQTEQEYLARFLSGKEWVVAREQKDFDLKEALSAMDKLNSIPHVRPNTFLSKAITDLLCRC